MIPSLCRSYNTYLNQCKGKYPFPVLTLILLSSDNNHMVRVLTFHAQLKFQLLIKTKNAEKFRLFLQCCIYRANKMLKCQQF